MNPRTQTWTIVDALRDPQVFGALPAFRDLRSWARWVVFLKTLYGLPLDSEEVPIFRHHTGRSRYAPPSGGYQTGAAIVGRQSGKTHITATVAVYEALVAARERGRTPLYALMTAQDHRAALRVLFAFATEPFEAIPLLQHSVRARTADTLTLDSGLTLAAYPCRPQAIRGVRARIAIADEIAHYRSAEGHPQDIEMLRALRPTLATTGGRLILLSSPYGQSGALWDLYRAHFGRDDSPVLIWQGTAPEMNPTLSADYLERMREDDPEGYRSEVLGEFRAGVTSLFDPEALEACVARRVRERLPEAGLTYRAACDPSGGRRDALTIVIGHEVDRRVLVDVVRAWEAPFNPSGVVAEASDLLQRYRVSRVVGDQYGAEWVAEAFRQHQVEYEAIPLDRSALYLELLPVVNAGAVVLLDLPPLLRELRGLERRRGVSGRDRIVPDSRDHDDRAVAVAGLTRLFIHPEGPGMLAEFVEIGRQMAATSPLDDPRWWVCPSLGCDFGSYTADREPVCLRCHPKGPTLWDLGLE